MGARSPAQFPPHLYVPLFPVSAVGYGSWFEHVQEFWEHRMDANVLFLKYEDMHRVSSWRDAVHQGDAAPGFGAVRGAGTRCC